MGELIKDYETENTLNFRSFASEVTQDIDAGMTFLEAVGLMKDLEQDNSPMEIGKESCTARFSVRNLDGENWSLIIYLIDASGEDEEVMYTDDAPFGFQFYTVDHGRVAYQEWLEQEVL